MSSKIENQPSSAENQLLTELQSTVKNRWDEFDNALPIGASFKSEYQSMKSAYDGLIADISPIKTDAELKQNQAVKTKLDTFLKQLSDYLKREDRRKDLDGTLVETNTQIAKLRDGIYIQRTVQAESGKLQQEVATNKPASTPDKKPDTLPTTVQAAAAVAGGAGIVATIESTGKNAEEAVKGIMKPLEKIKKWSSDIGSAWDAGWELVKKGDISKGIGLFFAVLFGGNLKDALAKYTGKSSSEENLSEQKEQEDKEKKSKETVKLLEDGVIVKTAGHLVQGTNKQEYGNFLSAAFAAIGDNSIYKDETLFRKNVESLSVGLITDGTLSTKKFIDLQGMSEQQLVSQSGSKADKEITLAACKLIHRMLQNNKVVFEQVFGKGNFETLSMRDILKDLYYQKGYGYVLGMNDKMSQFTTEDIADLPRNMFVDFEIKDGVIQTVKGGLLETRLSQFENRGLTLGLVQKMISTQESLSVTAFSSTIIPQLSNPEKQFIKEMTDVTKFLNPLKNSLQHYFGMPNEFLKHLNFTNLSIKDLFEIYMITGGQSNIAALNFGEQSMLSLKCLGIFSRLDAVGFGEYLKFVAENKTKYPIIAKIGSQAGGVANNVIYNLSAVSTQAVVKLAQMAGIDTTPEVAAAIASAGGAIWVIAKFLPIGRLISLIVLAGGGIAVFGTAAAQQSANSK